MRRLVATLGLFAASVLAMAPARAPAASEAGRASSEVQRITKDLVGIDERLQLVEKQYAYRPEPDEGEALRRRHSDAEIQYLLGNHQAASVLFYDLIGSQTFRTMREHPSALYMLAESLYQQGNLLGARLYFREHMNARGDHYRDALGRYLEISGRINEFSGIDAYIEQAKGPGGTLPGDVAYVYAKWLFRRTDLPDAERIARSREVFAGINQAGGAFTLQSRYFLGVLAVQERNLEAAAGYFQSVLELPGRDAREEKVRELANLSLGRVYFEQGKYSEAVDRYQEIDYRSENFIEALYEIAWAHVRRASTLGPSEYEKANQACEKLLMAANDSILAPEARILQGTLLLKLGKYKQASEAYTTIINDYLEVYDNIDGRLKAHADPVRYFQQLIAESGKTFDISALLPPIAVKWATTQRDVADAVRVTADLDASKKGVAESNEITARLLDALDKRELEVFPQYQEGLSRAEAVDSALTRAERELLQIEDRLLGHDRLAPIRAELDGVRQERQALEERFRSLPKTESEIEARKTNMAEQIRDVDQHAYQLGYHVESMFAVLAALEHFVSNTRDQRPDDVEGEREFASRMRQERAVADALRAELEGLQKQMRDEKARLGMRGSGDAELRARYEELLQHERDLLVGARVGVSGDAQAVFGSIDTTRQTISTLRARSAAAKGQIGQSVRRQAQGIREQVESEMARLKAYEREVATVSGNAQDLVGHIAYESFRRVRKQFYELVLKADVGLVDVAWTRKQDKTNEIHELAKQKDRDLKALDDEFKEVLKDVD